MEEGRKDMSHSLMDSTPSRGPVDPSLCPQGLAQNKSMVSECLGWTGTL